MASSPSGPANRASCGSQSRTAGIDVGRAVGDVRRVGHGEVEHACRRAGRRTTSPRRCARWPPGGRCRRGWRGRRRGRRTSVGQPDRDAVDRQLVGERQPDRPGAGAEVGDGDRSGAGRRPARSPRRRRPRSPAAGSAPGGRPRGRGGGSPTGRARRRAVHRRRGARACRRGGRPCGGVGRLVEHVVESGRRRSPPRTATALPGRSPTFAAVVSEQLPPADLTAHSSSASWRARSSAASASTTSSRSPASTSGRR